MRDPPKLVKAERGENLKKGGLASRLFLTYEPLVPRLSARICADRSVKHPAVEGVKTINNATYSF